MAQKCGILVRLWYSIGLGGEISIKWDATGDLSKLLSTPFNLNLKLHDVDQFLVDTIKAKLKYRSSTYLSFVSKTLIMSQVLMLCLWYFIAVWTSLKKVLRKIKAMLCNYLRSEYARTRVCWDDYARRFAGILLLSLFFFFFSYPY